MNYIRDFIITIVTAVIFITAVEIISPDKPIKKYIKFVLGLILVSIILDPIIYLFTRGETEIINTITNYSESVYERSTYTNNESINKEQEKSIEENLNRNSKIELEEEFEGLEFTPEIKCTFNFEDMTYSIDEVNVGVKSIGVNLIEKIVINLDESQEVIATEEDINEAEEISLYLANLLGVSSEKIKLYKEGGEE